MNFRTETIEQVISRFAKLSNEDKEKVVSEVSSNLAKKKKKETGKKDDKKSKGKKDDKSEESKDEEEVKDKKKSKSKSKSKSKKDEKPKKPEEPKEEEESEEESNDESNASDDSDGGDKESTNLFDKLQSEMEAIQSDGKVERAEFMGLLTSIIEMVNNLANSRPPVKKREGSQGQQTQRKDKDLMSDTGGSSKGRLREPSNKPPRDDTKNRHKEKRKRNDEMDNDTDRDKDKTSSLHPLDRKAIFAMGIEGPEDNYYRQVWSSLVHILAEENQVSEKAFSKYDQIMTRTDEFLRLPEVMAHVERFDSNGERPTLCSEYLFASYNTEDGDEPQES